MILVVSFHLSHQQSYKSKCAVIERERERERETTRTVDRGEYYNELQSSSNDHHVWQAYVQTKAPASLCPSIYRPTQIPLSSTLSTLPYVLHPPTSKLLKMMIQLKMMMIMAVVEVMMMMMNVDC